MTVEMINTYDLVAVGGITIDHIFIVNTLPSKNIASRILAYSRSFGGRAPNVAINLRKLGLGTAIISVAGNDFKSSGYMDYLGKLGIPSKGIVINSSKATTQVYIFTDKTGENYTFVNVGSEEIDGTIITNNRSLWGMIIKKAKILHISSGNPKLNVELAFMYKKYRQNGLISFDVGNDVFYHNANYLHKILSLSDFIFMNNEEYIYLIKQLNLENIYQIITKYLPIKCVGIIKRNRSIDLYIPTDELILRTQALKPSLLMDFTGTSDAFVSGILYGYLTSRSWKESVAIAQILIKNVGNHIGAHINCIAPKLELAQELNNIEVIKYG